MDHAKVSACHALLLLRHELLDLNLVAEEGVVGEVGGGLAAVLPMENQDHDAIVETSPDEIVNYLS